uniref:(northern house mosquito) hypothetical protein n=1 Tax=Culex pipiens TaxID=7175 RepID=A0A8D8A346_CULPI
MSCTSNIPRGSGCSHTVGMVLRFLACFHPAAAAASGSAHRPRWWFRGWTGWWSKRLLRRHRWTPPQLPTTTRCQRPEPRSRQREIFRTGTKLRLRHKTCSG